jgi:hypothetical protein
LALTTPTIYESNNETNANLMNMTLDTNETNETSLQLNEMDYNLTNNSLVNETIYDTLNLSSSTFYPTSTVTLTSMFSFTSKVANISSATSSNIKISNSSRIEFNSTIQTNQNNFAFLPFYNNSNINNNKSFSNSSTQNIFRPIVANSKNFKNYSSLMNVSESSALTSQTTKSLLITFYSIFSNLTNQTISTTNSSYYSPFTRNSNILSTINSSNNNIYFTTINKITVELNTTTEAENSTISTTVPSSTTSPIQILTSATLRASSSAAILSTIAPSNIDSTYYLVTG